MTNIILEENYKFKTKLMLPIELTIFLNLDKLVNWILYIGMKGVICFVINFNFN